MTTRHRLTAKVYLPRRGTQTTLYQTRTRQQNNRKQKSRQKTRIQSYDCTSRENQYHTPLLVLFAVIGLSIPAKPQFSGSISSIMMCVCSGFLHSLLKPD
jgi:hypothetical protein